MTIAAADPQHIVWHYAICKQFGWGEQTARDVLLRLVKMGWLSREPDAHSVRQRVLYRATAAGLAEAKKAAAQIKI